MTDEKAVEAFHKLSDMLRGAAMEWILTEVNDTLIVGQLEIKKVPATESPGEDDLFLSPRPRRVTASFTATAEYPPKERLRILINAIEQVWVATAGMQDYVATVFLKELNTNGHPISRFEFQSEDGIRQHKSEEAVRANRSRIAGILKPLLAELREAIDAT